MKSQPQINLSAKAQRIREQPISDLMAATVSKTNIVSLAPGLVDIRTLHVEVCAAIARRILSEPRRASPSLQYDSIRRLATLRRRVEEGIRTMARVIAGQLPKRFTDTVRRKVGQGCRA